MYNRSNNPHYIDNEKFSKEVMDYVNLVKEAKKNNKEIPQISSYIGQCFINIANGLSRRPNFIGYTYRDEMVADGIENCLKAIPNYNIDTTTRTGKPNAFSYFSMITFYAFVRRIQKENKQRDIKEKIIINSVNIEDFINSDGTDQATADYVINTLKNNVSRNNTNEEKEKKPKKRKKRQKVVDSDLSDFIITE